MLLQGWLLFTRGRFVSTAAAIYTWLPFFCVAALSAWLLGPGRAATVWLAASAATLVMLVGADAAVQRLLRQREAEASFDAKYGAPPHAWASSGAGFWDATLRPAQYVVPDPVMVRSSAHAV